MSIVLEALEKAQREGKKEKEGTGLSVETAREKASLKDISSERTRRPIRRYSIYLCIALLYIAGLGLWLFWSWPGRSREEAPVGPSKDLAFRDAPAPVPQPEEELPPEELAPEIRLPSLAITGVLWDPQEPIALVNGRLLKEGDEVSGATVEEIEFNRVRFLYKGEEFTIVVEQ